MLLWAPLGTKLGFEKYPSHAGTAASLCLGKDFCWCFPAQKRSEVLVQRLFCWQMCLQCSHSSPRTHGSTLGSCPTAPGGQVLQPDGLCPSSLFVLFITPFKHYSVFFLPFFFSCLWHSFLTCREMRAFAPCPSHPFSLKSQPPLTRGLHILGQCHRASGLLPKVQRAKMCTLAQTNYMLFVLHKHSHRVSCEMLWFHFLTFMGTFMHTFQWYTMFLRHMGNNKVFPWS